MLSQRETIALLDILANEDKSLESAAAAFQRAFVRADHFRVAAAMCIMIDDNLMPAMHRSVALFIIYELYKNEPPAVHPFMPFLVGLLQMQLSTDRSPRHERNLLCMLLSPSGAKDLPKKTPTELVAMWKPDGELLPSPPLVCFPLTQPPPDHSPITPPLGMCTALAQGVCQTNFESRAVIS